MSVDLALARGLVVVPRETQLVDSSLPAGCELVEVGSRLTLTDQAVIVRADSAAELSCALAELQLAAGRPGEEA